MKKIEIKRKYNYVVSVDGKNELNTSNKQDILNLINEQLKNNDVHIVIRDLK